MHCGKAKPWGALWTYRLVVGGWLRWSWPLVLGLVIGSILGSEWSAALGQQASATVAEEYIYACDFEAEVDINYDQWPDGWRRQTGTGFPRYNRLEIQADPLNAENRVLALSLDGGQAAVYSPAIKVSQQCSYRLRFRMYLPSREAHGREGWASLNFFTADEKKLASYDVAILRQTDDWVIVESPLVTAEQPEIASVVIGLHVHPTEATSLFGQAFFDDVSLQELPRLSLEFDNPLHVFLDAQQAILKGQVSGMRRADSQLQFELFDERGRPLRTERLPLQDERFVSEVKVMRAGSTQGYTVQQFQWKLLQGETEEAAQVHEGFYRLVITLLDRDVNPLVREMTFVVVEQETQSRERLFGMSLPLSVIELDPYALGTTLQQLGVTWLKLPVWLDQDQTQQAMNLGNLLQRLARLEIDVVGVLDEPPPAVYKKYWQHEQGISALTTDIGVFLEAVQPLLVELSLRIDRWQIGSDQDTGIAENLRTIDRMQKVKEHFLKFGEQTKVGLPWSWLQQLAPSEKEHWDFQSVGSRPPLTMGEFSHHVNRWREQTSMESFVACQPLSSNDYDLETRVQELCLQMIETKKLGVSRTFVPEPFAADSGLFRGGRNPSEMLLPWRTLAVHLSGAEYLGSIQFPNNSTNHWFSKGGEAFVLTWNQQSVAETLYLGKNAVMLDMWGRRSPLDLVGGVQSFTADKWPKLIRGLDLTVALIRLSLRFDRTALDSISTRPQNVKLTFKNFYPHGLTGSVLLSNPELLARDIRSAFQIGRQEQGSLDAPVQIRSGALTKQHMLQVDFKLAAEELPEFSAWQPLYVGAEDVEFTFRQRLDKNRFIIVVTLINRSPGPVTYTLSLYVPNRKVTNVMFYEIPPGQQSESIALYNIDELVGRTLKMRASNDYRSMNYQIKVE